MGSFRLRAWAWLHMFRTEDCCSSHLSKVRRWLFTHKIHPPNWERSANLHSQFNELMNFVATMGFNNSKRMEQLSGLLQKEEGKTNKTNKKNKRTSKKSTKNQELQDFVRSSSNRSGIDSSSDTRASTDSTLLLEDLWSPDTVVDSQEINHLRATWNTLKEKNDQQTFGERLVRKMIEIEPGSQWLMRLENLQDSPRMSRLCTELEALLESLLFLLEPDSEVVDVVSCAQQMRRQGVSPDLLADALPICLKSALRQDWSEQDESTWRKVFVPALRALEMPTLFNNDTLLY